MTENDFEQAIFLLAEVIGRPEPSKHLRKLYFSRLRETESSELRRALDVFATRGKWPTLADLMAEVGLVPPATRAERQGAETRAYEGKVEEKDLPTNQEKTAYGRWVFRSEAERIADLDAKKAELEALGWCVYMTRDFSVMKQRKIGNQTQMKRMFLRDYMSFRFPPEVPSEAVDAYRRLLCSVFAPK